MATSTSIIEEALAALRGVMRLVVGDRRAPEHFDPTPHGLMGSLIAFIAMVGLSSLVLTALPGGSVSLFRSVMADVLLYVGQIAMAAAYLRQIKRSEGFIPYLVATNWSTTYLTIAGLAIAFAMGGVLFMLISSIAILVTMINIARLVVGLSKMQVALFIGAQILGGVFGALVFMTMFPMSPAELEQLGLAQ